MRFALLAWIAAASLAATPAVAKEFRYYYGMQWVVTPTASAPATITVAKGEKVAEARMLTADLFETSDPLVVAGKPILGRGAQLATAVSSQSVRCTVSRGEPGTLSFSRRICLTDDDRDGQFDHYFDIGLGQGGADVQLTGCIPPDRIAIAPVRMEAVDPATLRDAMTFRVQLTRISGSPGSTSYRFGGSVGRNDRIWNYYDFCTPRSCSVALGALMQTDVEGIALRVLRQDGDKAVIEILRSLSKRDYWDMSRGNRPDPMYCPGTLFVKTDKDTF